MEEKTGLAGMAGMAGKKGGKQGRDWKFGMRIAFSAAVFALVVGVFMEVVSSFSGRARAQGAETLQSAITRACVQCYAMEGRYPPSVEYLEEEYGIQIDRERYYVFYDGFASNIMPEITVVPAEGGGGDE